MAIASSDYFRQLLLCLGKRAQSLSESFVDLDYVALDGFNSDFSKEERRDVNS